MKLTIEIDDELVRRAQRVAAERGRTLDAVIGEALAAATAVTEEDPSTGKQPRREGSVKLPVHRPTPGKEGFRPGVDPRSNASLLAALEDDALCADP